MPGSTITRPASQGTLQTLLTGFELIALGPAHRRRRRLALAGAAVAALAGLAAGAAWLVPPRQAPVAVAVASPVAKKNVYVVKAGDSLSTIAAAHLGDLHRWRELYALNRSVVTDPARLAIGTQLLLPNQEKAR